MLASSLLKKWTVTVVEFKHQQSINIKMKNNWIKVAAAVTAIVCFTGVVQAIPITGNIGFSGTADLNSGSVNTASAVVANGWANTLVGSDSGSFGFIPTLTPVIMTSSQWNFVSGALPSFWSVGGFTFNLISSSIFSQGGGFLNVLLSGTVSGNLYDVTPFSGSFQVSDPSTNGQVTFTERLSFNSVPDGGTTVVMLGLGLLSLGLFRKKLFA